MDQTEAILKSQEPFSSGSKNPVSGPIPFPLLYCRPIGVIFFFFTMVACIYKNNRITLSIDNLNYFISIAKSKEGGGQWKNEVIMLSIGVYK